MESAAETIRLLIEEITANYVKFGVELLQFALLATGFWVLAIGYGKRRGILVNAVDRRAQETTADLALVASAPSIVEAAHADAVRIRSEAHAQAEGLVREATMEAEAVRRDAAASAAHESAGILERADMAVQTEFAEMHAEIRDELVNIVADATRSVMNERLSLPEQRELIQNAILDSVGKGAEKKGASSKARAVARPRSEVS
jgi:F0F1-type ATP synthase membrane subunit b/b'